MPPGIKIMRTLEDDYSKTKAAAKATAEAAKAAMVEAEATSRVEAVTAAATAKLVSAMAAADEAGIAAMKADELESQTELTTSVIDCFCYILTGNKLDDEFRENAEFFAYEHAHFYDIATRLDDIVAEENRRREDNLDLDMKAWENPPRLTRPDVELKNYLYGKFVSLPTEAVKTKFLTERASGRSVMRIDMRSTSADLLARIAERTAHTISDFCLILSGGSWVVEEGDKDRIYRYRLIPHKDANGWNTARRNFAELSEVMNKILREDTRRRIWNLGLKPGESLPLPRCIGILKVYLKAKFVNGGHIEDLPVESEYYNIVAEALLRPAWTSRPDAPLGDLADL
jgi:hypothetical protein